MMKMKFGGWVLTGLGAYLIAGKVVKMVGKAVEDISVASRWKAYYKAFGKTGRSDMSVPEEKVVYVEKDTESGNSSPSTERLKDVIADSIQKATDALLEKQKGVNDPLEGQREAFKEDVCEKMSEKDSEETQGTDGKADRCDPLNRSVSYLIKPRNFLDLNGYRKLILYWYTENNVLLLDNRTGDDEIVDQQGFLGMDLLYPFRNLRNDGDAIFIRNDERREDYKVVRINGLYSAHDGEKNAPTSNTIDQPVVLDDDPEQKEEPKT